MDNKRVLIAVVLSFAVFVFFHWAFPPATEPEAPPTTPPPVAASVPPAAPAPQAKPVSPKPEEPAAPQDIHGDIAQSTEIENALYRALVYNEGGVLKSFQLKGFPDASGKPVELINGVSAAAVGWPLAFQTPDPKLDVELSQALFAVSRQADKLFLEFAGKGLHAKKTLEFDSANYLIKISTELERDGQPVAHQVLWQAGFGDQSIADDPKRKFAVYDTDAKFTRVALSGIKDPQEVKASLIGAEDQYFLSMFILPQQSAVKISETDFTGANQVLSRALRIAVPGGQTSQIYVGPKEAKHLQTAEARMVNILDYGMFGFISKPIILPALFWIHKHVGNYGWAIVIITILVNFVLFPLRLKSQLSMQKMQKIQPQVNALQDKMKKLKATDPRRAEIQSEIMKIYSEHGSPISGCLPLLLQMPVMFSFYSMLSVAIELRHAPWILWIRDLSLPDPYYIIPILMAVAMVIGQKMTPTSVDPAQAKMMMVMPVLMTFFFLWVQSGLTLYWLTSNLVGIGQQWFIRKYWSGNDSGKTTLIKAGADR